MDVNNANIKVSPEKSGLTLSVESNDAATKLKTAEADSSDESRDERRHKKKKKDRKRSRDRDDDRKRSKKDSRDDRSRSRDRHNRSDRDGRDRSRERRDREDRDSKQRELDLKNELERKAKSDAASTGKDTNFSASDADARTKGASDSSAADSKRDSSRDKPRDDRRADSRDRDRGDRRGSGGSGGGRRRSRSRSGDRRYRDDRYRRDEGGRRGGDHDRNDRGSSRRSSSRDRSSSRRSSSAKSGSTGGGGRGGGGTGSSSSGAAAAEENSGPKPVTLRDIMNANPGISMPEAVMRLNAYNTALARGEVPPPLSGSITVSSVPAILPLGLAHLNPTTLGAVTSAAGVSLGEGGAATRPHREIYVGNLPPGITVPQLTEFLNGAMKQMGISKDGQNSVITAWVAPDGHFAFAEVRTIEEANAAMLHLNGVQIGQFALRIGRPKGYNGTGSAVPMMGGPSAVAGLNPLLSGLGGGLPGIPGFSGGVSEPPSNVIMCSNLSVLIGEEQIRELFLPFGPLKAFNLIKTLNGQTQSAVLEYEDPSVTDIVVQGLHRLEIADLKLSVQRIPQSMASVLLVPAVKETPKSAAAAPATTVTPPVPAGPPPPASVAAAAAASAAAPVADPLTHHPPSSVIRLSNMTTAEDLTSDESYNDLLEDVADECNSHGAVKSIVIPRGFDASRGQIFVHFANVSDAQKCLQAVQGRRFNGKIVHGVYYPESLFTTKVYVVPSDFVIGIRGGSRRQQVDMDTLD